MSAVENLLVELLVEEMPPKALKKLGEAFAAGIRQHLEVNDFLGAGAVATAFASPRRLAVHLTSVRWFSEPRPKPPISLMPTSVAYKDGLPTQALIKRLMKEGFHEQVDFAALIKERAFVEMEGGKEVLKFRDDLAAGSTLPICLEGAIEQSLYKLPIPKLMSYQLEGQASPELQPGWTTVKFVRPAHGLVALHGDEFVDVYVSALGLAAGRSTQGHRFEAALPKIELRHADCYAEQLRDEGAVIASFAERRAEIVRQIDGLAAAQGLSAIQDEALLDEVTALVERPNVLLCQFEPEFLAVPQECLILTMKANQKYFPLLDSAGRLTHQFLVVSNIRPADPSRVIEGNERVVRPRLADAKFFFDQDRKKPLAERVAGLDRVVYHHQLGSQGQRTQRVRQIASEIGLALGGPVLAAAADTAAHLAKADLLTDMVGEFPELQGVMGGYYARHDGLTEDIACAIEDHYKPRFAGDSLPRQPLGMVAALADKLETLAGLFGIGQVPTGDKDPFALRRHALGVIRMLIEARLPLALAELVDTAFAAFPAGHGQAQGAVLQFMRERLSGYLRERGYSPQEVEAVVEPRPAHWADIPNRLDAVRAFAALPEAAALAAANKRVGNILKKSDGASVGTVQPSLLVEPAEAALNRALVEVDARAKPAFAAGDYTGSLKALAALRAPVDAFFDGVMVNTDDLALRQNRLALLSALHQAMNRVADLSRLAS